MSFPTYGAAKWMVRSTRVAWDRQINSTTGKEEKRKSFYARLEKQADSYSTAASSAAFTNAAGTVTNLVGYIGKADGASEEAYTFYGEWQIDDIDVSYADNIAYITLTIYWQESTWTTVTEASYTTTTTSA